MIKGDFCFGKIYVIFNLVYVVEIRNEFVVWVESFQYNLLLKLDLLKKKKLYNYNVFCIIFVVEDEYGLFRIFQMIG